MMQVKKSDWERKEIARQKLDEKNRKHNAREQKRCHREWKTCFAWLPKTMMNGRVLWLERVRLRRHPGSSFRLNVVGDSDVVSKTKGSVDYKESLKRIHREDAAEAAAQLQAEIALESGL